MKRILTILLCALILAAGLYVVLTPQVVPYSRCSAVYQRYADVDGVDAAFLKDYKVNDTLAVDVTVLKATDSASWAMLQKDFNFKPPEPRALEFLGEDAIFVKSAPKADYSLPKDPIKLNNDIISIYWKEQSIYIFHVQSLNQIKAIRNNQYEQSITNSINNN